MADPALEAGGATVFPATGALGEPTPTSSPATLVGQEVATFALGAVGDRDGRRRRHGAGHARSPRRRSQARSTPGHQLVAGSSKSRSATPSSSASRSASRSIASAEQIAILDRRGAQGEDPRQADRRGEGDPRAVRPGVELSVWPDWIGSVPGFESRVTVTIDQAVQIEHAGPSAPAATARPTPTPTPPASPSP